MPCLPSCKLPSNRPDAPPHLPRGNSRRGQPAWRLGDHFLGCPAGAAANGLRNITHRHDSIVRLLAKMLNIVFLFSVQLNRRDNHTTPVNGECTDIVTQRLSPPDAMPNMIDVTILTSTSSSYTANSRSAAKVGISEFLQQHGDNMKRLKHAPNARAYGAEFTPFSLDVRGAFGPSAKSFWDSLWKPYIKAAPSRGESTWAAVAECRSWLQRFSILLANENAEIIQSKAGAFWKSHHDARFAFIRRFPHHRPLFAAY